MSMKFSPFSSAPDLSLHPDDCTRIWLLSAYYRALSCSSQAQKVSTFLWTHFSNLPYGRLPSLVTSWAGALSQPVCLAKPDSDPLFIPQHSSRLYGFSTGIYPYAGCSLWVCSLAPDCNEPTTAEDSSIGSLESHAASLNILYAGIITSAWRCHAKKSVVSVLIAILAAHLMGHVVLELGYLFVLFLQLFSKHEYLPL